MCRDEGSPVVTPVPKPKVRKQKKRFAAKRDPQYCAWIREQDCLVTRRDPDGTYPAYSPIQVCHVTSRGAGGHDRGNVVPLCLWHHAKQHSMGTKSFERVYGVDLKAHALALEYRYRAEHP